MRRGPPPSSVWLTRRLTPHGVAARVTACPRTGAGLAARLTRRLPHAARLLALIPAFNEAPNLARVVRELRRRSPELDILIVNDGSTDGTADLLPTLGRRLALAATAGRRGRRGARGAALRGA